MLIKNQRPLTCASREYSSLSPHSHTGGDQLETPCSIVTPPGRGKTEGQEGLRPEAKLGSLRWQQAAWFLLDSEFLDSSHLPGEKGGILQAAVHMHVCCAF